MIVTSMKIDYIISNRIEYGLRVIDVTYLDSRITNEPMFIVAVKHFFYSDTFPSEKRHELAKNSNRVLRLKIVYAISRYQEIDEIIAESRVPNIHSAVE